jgi:hypothetical protein
MGIVRKISQKRCRAEDVRFRKEEIRKKRASNKSIRA